MPVLDGIGAIRIIRALADPKKSGIPIIVASASELSKEACLELGVTFILKPYNMPDLSRKIEEVIKETISNQSSITDPSRVFLPSFDRLHALQDVNSQALKTNTLLPNAVSKSGKRRCTSCTIS